MASSAMPKVDRSPETRLYLSKPNEAALVVQLDLSGARLERNSGKTQASGRSKSRRTDDAPSPVGHRLTNVPSVIEKYVNLKILDLSGNKLQSVHHLDKCPKLRSLDLSRNALRIFPLRLRENRQLTHLNISGNFISKIPRNISLLAGLVSLELSGNRLHNLPDIKHLKPLKHLRHLWIKGNMFSVNENTRYFTIFHVRQLEELDGVVIDAAERRRLADFNKRHASKIDNASPRQPSGPSKVTALQEELTKKSELLKRQGEEFADVSAKLSMVEQELAFLKLDKASDRIAFGDESTPGRDKQLANPGSERSRANALEPATRNTSTNPHGDAMTSKAAAERELQNLDNVANVAARSKAALLEKLREVSWKYDEP